MRSLENQLESGYDSPEKSAEGQIRGRSLGYREGMEFEMFRRETLTGCGHQCKLSEIKDSDMTARCNCIKTEGESG